MATKPVTFNHDVAHVLPEVVAARKTWDRIRAVINGGDAVRENSEYLPALNPTDTSTSNIYRNRSYRLRAQFFGATKRTLKGLVGQVFGKPAVLTVPAELEYLQRSVDGGAVSIDQQAKQTLSDNIAIGRAVLLVDHPKTEGTVTRAQQIAERVMPTIQYYFAEQLINWRVGLVKGERKLTLVVLEEEYVAEDDGFKKKMAKQWRVLRIVNDQCFGQVWRKDTSGAYYAHDVYQPRDARGTPFDFIPVFIVGADNNDPGIDDSPLSDMAELNIGHFRNSADLEDSAFIVGQATPVFIGVSQEWVDEVFEEHGIALGSRRGIPLPKGGDAKLLQAEPNSLVKELMIHKEEQMKALGAKLVEPRTGERTLGEAQMDAATDSSVLATCTENVSAAYTAALRVCALFLGVEVPENATLDEFGYRLNTDFEIARMTVEQRRQLLAEWQAGAISTTEYRSVLQRTGIATQELEEFQAEVDAAVEKDLENQIAVIGARRPVQDEVTEE